MVIGEVYIDCKNVGTPEEKEKGRFVAQGYKDADKPYDVYDNATLRTSNI